MIGYKKPLAKAMMGYKKPLGKSMMGYRMPLLVKPAMMAVADAVVKKATSGLERNVLRR